MNIHEVERSFCMSKQPEVVTSKTSFSAEGKEVSVFIARPEGVEKAPAIIIVHEWWGLNPHIEDVAQRYAREGFIAVATDLYHGVTTKDHQEAAKLMGSLKPEDGLASLKIVLDHLRSMDEVTSVGVTGFCMGGTFALLLACHEKVEASVPFYGDVPVDTTVIGRLGCPLLFIGGEKDEWITIEKMNRLDTALKQYSKDAEVRVYKGASHAFFNDTRPEVFSKSDAEDAWRTVIEFFNRHLRKGQAAGA
jgi:carboxymethylenebutenolidase